MSDFAAPRDHVFLPVAAVSGLGYGGKDKAGSCPWPGTHSAVVRFDKSGRTYNYWVPVGVVAISPKYLRVHTPDGLSHVVEVVKYVQYERLHCKAITGYYVAKQEPPSSGFVFASPQATTSVINTEPTPMSGITITDQTLVNGADIKSLSDAHLYDLLAKEHKAIEALEALPVQPKKLKRQIVERKEALQKLADLIDRDEPKET